MERVKNMQLDLMSSAASARCTWLLRLFSSQSQLISGTIVFVLLTLLQCGTQQVEGHILVYRRITNQLIEEYNDMPAQFGPSLPANGLKAYGITANPITGCNISIVPPPKDSYPPKTRFVAIIERGGCVFEMKVRNAQSSSFDAVIVYNNEGDDLEQMSAQNSTGIHIPAVFVGETAGMNLRSLAKSPEVVFVINDELPFNINTQLILPFSILIGLCFLIMIFYMVYKCIREERRLRRYRLPKSMLKKLPIIKYTKNNTLISFDTCVICLDEFVEGDKLRILPCNHPYHSHCIDPWLTEMRRVCPICKRKVFTKGEARANRNRQYSLDSVTDTDDDTTPLLQTSTATAATASSPSAGGQSVDAATTTSARSLRTGRRNNTHHGTFRRSAERNYRSNADTTTTTSDDENVLLAHQSPAHRQGNSRRVNPFDRTPNLPRHLAQQFSDQNNQTNSNRWSFRNLPFLSLFRRAPVTISVAAPPYVGDAVVEVVGNTHRRTAPVSLMTSAGTPSINASAAAASNNILNPNLSGSFKDDDDLPPHQSIYEPISAITPTVMTNNNNNAIEDDDDDMLSTAGASNILGDIVAMAYSNNVSDAASRQFLV